MVYLNQYFRIMSHRPTNLSIQDFLKSIESLVEETRRKETDAPRDEPPQEFDSDDDDNDYADAGDEDDNCDLEVEGGEGDNGDLGEPFATEDDDEYEEVEDSDEEGKVQGNSRPRTKAQLRKIKAETIK